MKLDGISVYDRADFERIIAIIDNYGVQHYQATTVAIFYKILLFRVDGASAYISTNDFEIINNVIGIEKLGLVNGILDIINITSHMPQNGVEVPDLIGNGILEGIKQSKAQKEAAQKPIVVEDKPKRKYTKKGS